VNNSPERKALRAFVAAYIECALWSSTASGAPDMEEDDDTSMESYGYSHDDIAPVSKRAHIRECIDFYRANEALLMECSIDDSQHGDDFWLTRNGHGAGFWDRGYGPKGAELTKAAKAYGSCDPYVGDDEKVYLS
jgi:hypothetical protein